MADKDNPRRHEVLVALQNLDIMIREVKAGHEQEMGFQVDKLDALKSNREKLAARVPEKDLAIYERVAARYGYVSCVVPVQNRICLGCFMGLPTSTVRPDAEHDELLICENCGRLLYWV